MRNCVVLLCYLLSISDIRAQSEVAFHHFKIDINAKKVDFFDLIESVEFVRLEETENSLLGDVEDYFDTPNGIGLRDYKTNSVIFFNDQGDFVSAFNRFGGGPEEYQHLGNLWYKGGKVELYDTHGKRLQSYTLEGEYIGTRKIAFEGRPVDVFPYEEGYLMTLVGETMRDTTAGPELLIVDHSLKIQAEAFHRQKPHPFPINRGGYYMKHDDRLIVKRKLNQSAYVVKNNRLIPFIKFDFGVEWAWNDPQSSATVRNASEMITRGGKVYELVVKVGEEFIDVQYFRNLREKYRGYIEWETGEFRHYDLRINREENFNLLPIKWEEDRLVHSLVSDELEAFIEKLDKKPWKVKGAYPIEQLVNSENPVLVYVKFKPL